MYTKNQRDINGKQLCQINMTLTLVSYTVAYYARVPSPELQRQTQGTAGTAEQLPDHS